MGRGEVAVRCKVTAGKCGRRAWQASSSTSLQWDAGFQNDDDDDGGDDDGSTKQQQQQQ